EKPEKPRKPEKNENPPSEVIEWSRIPFEDLLIYVIFGYITGIILVLLCYLLFGGEKERSDINLKWMLIVLLVLFILMICYSHTTRCIGVLLLPVLGGYRGRLLIIAWCFYLAMTGPVLNIIRNIDIMIRSLACGQGLLHSALTPMHQIMGEPVYVVEQSVYTCLSQVRSLMERLEDVLQRLETPILGLYTSYSRCGEWLRHQKNFFDNQMGTPYDRCLGAGNISVQECLIKFSGEKSMCDMEQRFAWFCSNLKDLASFFDPYMQQHQELSEQIFTRKLQVRFEVDFADLICYAGPLESFDKIRSIFAVSITFDHVQKATEDAEPSNRDTDVELGKVLDWAMRAFTICCIWLGYIIVILLVFVLLSAIYCRVNFLFNVHFMNVYLTPQFIVCNDEMARRVGYSALPLRTHEKSKYVKLSSFKHLDFEMKMTEYSWMFLIITTLQLFIICFVDVSLFWMLATMSYHSHQTADLQPPQYTKIQVDDGGMIGFMLRGLVQAFEPLSKSLFVDVQHCLPLPGPPKYLRYWEISMLCLLAWLLLPFDGYSLRARHLIMANFYPENSNERAKHTLQRLMRDRGNITNYLQCCKCCSYFHGRDLKQCLRAPYRTNLKLSPLFRHDTVRCETPKCRGIFCQTCFIESNCHCIICNPPTVYGDYNKYSEVE
ncbi:hypothetical protein KR093_006082, partial [Drosophila rubida]